MFWAGAGQEWQQSLQPLAANPVRCLPKNFQRISFSFLVNSTTSTPNRRLSHIASEQAHRMLSMGWKPVTTTNSSRMRTFSARLASLSAARRRQSVPLRVAMLGCLVASSLPPHPSSSAEQIWRQRLSIREHSRRRNADSQLDCRAARRSDSCWRSPSSASSRCKNTVPSTSPLAIACSRAQR
jgi:hypothetical protein